MANPSGQSLHPGVTVGANPGDGYNRLSIAFAGNHSLEGVEFSIRVLSLFNGSSDFQPRRFSRLQIL
jgi:hypothetical protein